MPMSDAASDPAAATPPVPSAPKAGAIAGIGMDLLRIDRIERALARHGDRFAEKILGVEELRKFHARRARDPVRGVRFLATRFAAKEAFPRPSAWACACP